MPDREARLGEWLRQEAAFGPDATIVDLRPLAGGQSSELLSLVCRRTGLGHPERYVIRMEQRGKQLFLEPDIAREYRVMEGLAAAGKVPVPPLMGLEATGEILGLPFMVMREVEGRAPLGRPSMHVQGLLAEIAPAERRELAFNAMGEVAAIHTTAWRRTHAFLSEGAKGIDRHLSHLGAWYRWAAQGRSFPLTDRALEHLLRHRQHLSDEEDVLLWGDARPGNILFKADRSVAAVLDWEGALVGPRSLDVGYWLMMDSFVTDMVGIERAAGWPDHDEFVRYYREASGAQVHDIDYFIVLGAFFIAVTLIRATDIGIAIGRLPADTRMAHANTATQIIAAKLGLPVPALSPDFARHRGLDPGFSGPRALLEA